MLTDKQMSLLVELKIAGISDDVATSVMQVLNEKQAIELAKFVVENKPLTEKVLLDKVKELTNKDN